MAQFFRVWILAADASEISPEMIALPKPAVARPDLFLFVVAGLFMAAVGAFGTFMAPLSLRLPYWLVLMVGGGTVLSICEQAIRTRIRVCIFRVRPDVAAAAVTAPVIAAFVWCVSIWTFSLPIRPWSLLRLIVPVLVVSGALVALRRIAVGSEAPRVAEDLPGDAALPKLNAIRDKLPLRLRHAEIQAIEADDHYLRIHTGSGDAHIHMRMQDALIELSGFPGFQVHRSWWVAEDAISSVRWARGRGTIKLKGGELVPVSRGFAATIRSAIDQSTETSKVVH